MNLIRYYNQNRKKIKGILIIMVSAFIFLQLVNQIYKINNEQNVNNVENNTNQIIEISTNTTQVTTDSSVVTGKQVNKEELKSTTTVIDQFMNYCNNRELEKAYDMLTDECKNEIFNSLEIFEKAYYDDIFNGKSKICTVENWVNDTYKVRITDDMLSTGKSNNGYAKQDYITVKRVNDEYKLNINNYVGYAEVNETTEHDNIKMEVLSKNTYMEYEEYKIKITNNTEDEMLLDSREDVKSLFLQDDRGTKYSSYSHELTDPMLTIASGQDKEVTIKFYSSYVSTKKIEYIVFSDIILVNGQLSEGIEFKANV